MIVRNAAPFLINHGFITQAYYDETMETLYRELGPNLEGFFSSAEVIARKPL
jgi:hypothetical protein